MCGRFGLTNSHGRVSKMFPGVQLLPDLEARYNIAPTQLVLAVGRGGAELLRWGIAGKTPTGHFNLRAETILRLPPGGELLTAGRVIVPASHFYEWTGSGPRRHPLSIARQDGELLALAGLRSKWIDPTSGEVVPAVTLLTTEPNALLAALHNRMPVILDHREREEWRSGLPLTRDRLRAILVPYPDGRLIATQVSKLVNSARNEGPELLGSPPPETGEQLELLTQLEGDTAGLRRRSVFNQ